MKPEIIEEHPITMSELKGELAKISKGDDELNFRSQRTVEYLDEFVTDKKLDGLKEKLIKLNISRLKEEHICKIVDLLPETPEDLKSILQGYTITITNENLKKIVDVVVKR
jgi:DNA-directed RNA polymerase subunit F|tara:strand:+ start:404 stop:736 length:333 start_codon:yes stop_codon:yes gene_type:complete